LLVAVLVAVGFLLIGQFELKGFGVGYLPVRHR